MPPHLREWRKKITNKNKRQNGGNRNANVKRTSCSYVDTKTHTTKKGFFDYQTNVSLPDTKNRLKVSLSEIGKARKKEKIFKREKTDCNSVREVSSQLIEFPVTVQRVYTPPDRFSESVFIQDTRFLVSLRKLKS